MTRLGKNVRIDISDAVIALAISVYIINPYPLAAFGPHTLLALHVKAVDAIFGFTFVYAWQYTFSVLHLYDKFATIPSRISSTLRGIAIMMVPLLLHLYLFHHALLTFHIALTMMVVLFFYEITRMALSVHLLDRLAARDPRRAIILGSGRRASKAWREIRTRYHSSIKLLGFVDDRSPDEMPPDVASRYLGAVDDLNTILLTDVVDVLLIAMPIQSCYPLMQRAVDLAEAVGVRVVYLNDIYSTRKHNEDPTGSIFRELAPQHERFLMRLTVKRALDICGALVGLVLLSPVFLVVGIAVALTSKGPVFFQQERYGHNRRKFRMVKFRSMVADAERLLPSLEQSNEADGPIFKMTNDPRVTKIGKILRKLSIDELPQLWNVLMGDMSLVGPRPMTVRDVSLFNQVTLMRRFSVKPGMTGLWQVNGRSSVGFDQWVTMDSSYIDGWSLLLDLKILYQTVNVVFRRSGAV